MNDEPFKSTERELQSFEPKAITNELRRRIDERLHERPIAIRQQLVRWGLAIVGAAAAILVLVSTFFHYGKPGSGSVTQPLASNYGDQSGLPSFSATTIVDSGVTLDGVLEEHGVGRGFWAVGTPVRAFDRNNLGIFE